MQNKKQCEVTMVDVFGVILVLADGLNFLTWPGVKKKEVVVKYLG